MNILLCTRLSVLDDRMPGLLYTLGGPDFVSLLGPSRLHHLLIYYFISS